MYASMAQLCGTPFPAVHSESFFMSPHHVLFLSPHISHLCHCAFAFPEETVNTKLRLFRIMRFKLP